VVFVSHATPEDNAITAWYGARLTAAGYTVWTDLSKLLGGEETWQDIADVLRARARKAVVLFSRHSVDAAKDGFRAEVDRALALRKLLGDRRFVIPVRTDDVPYTDLPPTISNKLVISADDGHAAALARVLRVLEEDQVPCRKDDQTNALRAWQKVLAPEHSTLESGKDLLVSTWYPILRLPKQIRFFDIGRPLANLTEPAQIASDHPIPMVGYLRRLVAFADWDEAQEPIAETTPIKLDYEMTLDRFLVGGDDKVPLDRGEARKMLVSILRQSFNLFAESKGLEPFALSDKKNAWWMPQGVISKDQQSFTRVSGTKGYRNLCGQYGARERIWHFAVSAVALVDEPIRMKITPHLVYTDPSGANPPTADYRRSHARLWFNAKWRDLTYAMIHYLSGGLDSFALPLGREASAEVLARPLSMSLDFRPPVMCENRAKKKTDAEGDAADLDMADFFDDPAFSSLAEDRDQGDENDEAERNE